MKLLPFFSLMGSGLSLTATSQRASSGHSSWPGNSSRRQRSVDSVKVSPQQPAAHNLKEVPELNVEQTCAEQGPPVLPVFAILFGCCWVLREITVAWVIWDNVQVDFEKLGRRVDATCQQDGTQMRGLASEERDVYALSCAKQHARSLVHVRYVSTLQAVCGRRCFAIGSNLVFADSVSKVVDKHAWSKQSRRSSCGRVSAATTQRVADSFVVARAKWW